MPTLFHLANVVARVFKLETETDALLGRPVRFSEVFEEVFSGDRTVEGRYRLRLEPLRKLHISLKKIFTQAQSTLCRRKVEGEEGGGNDAHKF